MDVTANKSRLARQAVGIWTEWPSGVRWANEGMTRLLGFIIEGGARGGDYVFRVVVPEPVHAPAAADLVSLAAVLGLDYTVHSPPRGTVADGDFAALAKFADEEVPVDGWLVLFPYFRHAVLLSAPVATIFPDANPLSFPVADAGAWGPDGYHVRWRDQVRELLSRSARVITFSRHVAEQQATAMFGVPAERIRVVPHAPPDLIGLLPWLDRRAKNKESVRRAAQMLRDHAAERGWHYLRSYPFEEVAFVAVSTQDRVSKNLRIIAESVRVLVREHHSNVKLLTTAPLHFGATWTALPDLLEREQLTTDVISMPDLPRTVHAAFYHCATLVVHPALFEGGLGPFPFYEAVSVGTPCLTALGPHTLELLDDAPELEPFMFRPNDVRELVALISDVLANIPATIDVQMSAYDRLCRYGWAEVAAAYASAAVEQG